MIVPAPEDTRFAHLAWPKVVKAKDGTLVVAYVAARAHTVAGCPAVSRSADGGRTFTPPHVLQEFSDKADYAHCGNLALGLAGDGSVVILAMAFTGRSAIRSSAGARPMPARRGSRSTRRPWRRTRRARSTGTSSPCPTRDWPFAGTIARPPSRTPHGLWIAFSKDDGRTWGAAQPIATEKLVEPAVTYADGRLVGLFRDATKAHRYWQGVSDDKGATWQIAPGRSPTMRRSIRSPARSSPVRRGDPAKLYALQSLRGVKGEHKGEIHLWTADAKTLKWQRLGLVAALPKTRRTSTGRIPG